MRGVALAAITFAAGLAAGYFIWNEGGAGGRTTRVVTQEAAAPRRTDAEIPETSPPRTGSRVESIRVPISIEVPNGQAPERARIVVVRPRTGIHGESTRAWTSAEPWIDVPTGTWELCAELEEPARSRSSVRTVSVRLGDEPAPVQFVVQARPALVVDIRPASQFVSATYVCWIRRLEGDRAPTPQALVAGGGGAYQRDGTSFFWRGLEPGRYAVGAAYGETAPEGPQVIGSVEVVRGLERLEIDLPDPPAAGALRIRVLDPEGQPVTRVIWTVRSGGAGSLGAESVVRSDGVHYVTNLDMAPGATFRLEAKSPEWGVAAREFDWDPERIEEIRYANVARVSGLVRGYAGSGYEGRIRIRWEAPDGEAAVSLDDLEASSRIGSDGVIASHPQQAGEWTLALYVTGKSLAMVETRRIATKRVLVQPGAQHVTIEMPRLCALRVRWTGQERPESVSIAPADANEEIEDLIFAAFDEDGVATFDGLLAGRYRLFSPTLAADAEPPVVEVPARSDIELK